VKCLSGVTRSRALACLVIASMAVFVAVARAQQVNQRTKNLGAWLSHAHDAQHTGISRVASQPLKRVHWQTPVDLQPQLSFGELLIHYGSPLITSRNTVIVPVKTGATDGFRVESRDGRDGSMKWTLNTDYSVPSASVLY
jgi:hypothetical protein